METTKSDDYEATESKVTAVAILASLARWATNYMLQVYVKMQVQVQL